jgi:hypothetical protein
VQIHIIELTEVEVSLVIAALHYRASAYEGHAEAATVRERVVFYCERSRLYADLAAKIFAEAK